MSEVRVHCHAKGCQTVVYRVCSTADPTRHQCVKTVDHARTVGSVHFCTKHTEEAEQFEKEREAKRKGLSESEVQELLSKDEKPRKEDTHDHSKKNKACEKYSHLSRFGLSHTCSQALLELRRRTECEFPTVAELYKEVDRALEFHTSEMMDRLLGVDTKDRKFFRSWSGE